MKRKARHLAAPGHFRLIDPGGRLPPRLPGQARTNASYSVAMSRVRAPTSNR